MSFQARNIILKEIGVSVNISHLFEIQFERSPTDEEVFNKKDELVANTLKTIFTNHLISNGPVSVYFLFVT
ncbi:MAG: hypothetical protein JWQ40_881 [Segetibacter sp.]|nr:hypothetical protein [Segetibacter sp.]